MWAIYHFYRGRDCRNSRHHPKDEPDVRRWSRQHRRDLSDECCSYTDVVEQPPRAFTCIFGFPRWDGKGVIINARCETALEKPTFSWPLMNRRCVIPSTGFYEWAYESILAPQLSFFPGENTHSAKEPKVKLHFRRPGEPMLYMAGMMSTFTDNTGNSKDAFTILTTAANETMAPFHDRMPVILAASECEEWISSEGFMREVLTRMGPELEWRAA